MVWKLGAGGILSADCSMRLICAVLAKQFSTFRALFMSREPLQALEVGIAHCLMLDVLLIDLFGVLLLLHVPHFAVWSPLFVV